MFQSLKVFLADQQSRAIAVSFMTMSLLMSTWFARLPEVKDALTLDKDSLGIALLGMGLGSILGSPLCGWLSSKLSIGKLTFWSAIALCILSPLPIQAIGMWSLFAFLFIVGMTDAFLNISMNTAATSIEKHRKLVIMSTCHGMFSLGFAIGSGLAGVLSDMGVSFTANMIGLGVVLMFLNTLILPTLKSIPDQKTSGSGFQLPPASLLIIAGICFCFSIAEGSIADWCSIYMKEEVKTSAFWAGIALSANALGMTIGRFNGDWLRQRFKGHQLVGFMGFLGAGGLLIAIFFPVTWIAILGFFIMGLGISIVMPLLYLQGLKAKNVAPGIGLASIASVGTLGFLLGPPIIGFIAEATTLSISFMMIATLLVLAAILTFRTTFVD